MLLQFLKLSGWILYIMNLTEWTPGVGDGQGGLECCSSWGLKESDTTEQLNWTGHNILSVLVLVFKTVNLISFCTVNVSFKSYLLWLIKCKDCTCYYASFYSYIFSQGTCFNEFILRSFKSNYMSGFHINVK